MALDRRTMANARKRNADRSRVADDSRHFSRQRRAAHRTFAVWSAPEKPNSRARSPHAIRSSLMAANKSQEAVERLWEVTRHLSQGANAGPGGIFSIDQDGGRLIVTLMEGEATGRRYSLEVKSHRKVPVDSIIVPAEGAESGGVEDSQGEAGAR